MKSLKVLPKKVLFIGLGGAGQRHLRIFQELLPEECEFSAFRVMRQTPLLKPNFSVDSSVSLEEKYGLILFKTMDEALESRPDVAVIANPTALHFETARKAVEKKIDVFVEKPFSHNLEGFTEFRKLVLKDQIRFFVAYNRRFHTQLQKMKTLLDQGAVGKPILAIMNVGSYLPEWHPYEDFHRLYACRQDLGGGVLLTEIHELDLCYWFFGLPKSVYCFGGNFSHVPMDVEDSALVTLNYGSFAVQVNLCFMQKQVRRDIIISGTEGSLEWSQADSRLVWTDFKNNQMHNFSDPEFQAGQMFMRQAAYFLHEMTRDDIPRQLDRAWASLAIIEAAKRSMARKVEVEIPPCS